MQFNENEKNRGTHGDSLRMLDEVSSSNKNPPDLSVGSVKEKGFESGDKVCINCPGVFNGRVGRVIKSEHCKYGDSVYVDLHYDTPEPLSQIFAAEHLELVVDPEEEEKAGEIKDAEKHPYRMAVEKLLDRQEEKGISKYGVTLDKNVTLTGTQRIEHLEEELIDALMYCEHLKAGIGGDNLTADDYQRAALRTAQTDKFSRDDLLQNGVMGLCGEAGEVIDLVKKWKFQGHELDIEEVKQELGDTLWYAAVTAYALGYNLSEVMATNIDKLKERYKDGFSKERSINRKEYKSEGGNFEKVSADVPD